MLGAHATAARRDGDDYVLELDDGRELRGDRLLVATGRRPRVGGLGLETSASSPTRTASRSTSGCAPATGVWAIGDVTGILPLTYVGEYQGRRRRREHPRRAARRRTTRPCRVWSSPIRRPPPSARTEARFTATARLAEVPRTATYTRAYAESNGFLTLLSDGERLTGAYALGPEAGEWLQQATLAVRPDVPLDVLRDTIQPFPSFSEI